MAMGLLYSRAITQAVFYAIKHKALAAG
jgi:hypothetical protein